MPQSKTLPHRQTSKICQNCKAKFTIEPEDFEFYQKIDVPEPTFCPECRIQRRLAFKHEARVYRRKCDFSGKEIFSNFSPTAPVKVYDRGTWFSDKWDPMEYGQDYDFNRPFFEQFRGLLRQVPLPSRSVSGLVNSDYAINSANLKNCYLIFGSHLCENSAYIYRSYTCSDLYDSAFVKKGELCYQGFMLNRCYKAFFSSYCDDCQEILFSTNCVDCQNCLGCANLRHKKYHIFNKPYAKQEYEKKLKEFDLGSFRNIQELNNQARTLWLKHPVKFMHGRKNVNVSGDYIYNSKNVENSYMIRDGEDLKYCQFMDLGPVWDCYDFFSFAENASLVYETTAVGRNVSRIKFCVNVYIDVTDIEYSYECISSSHLFGCVGLHHKQHCILNKQYTKGSFDKLRIKIIEHMNQMPYQDKKGRVYKYGELFPAEFATLGYNESPANEYFPLTKEQAIEQGYSWYDKPKPEYQPTIKAADLPDNIKDVDKSILKEVIQCGSLETKFPKETRFPSSCAGSGVFRIIPQEYEFYKKMNLPLPRTCPDCRHRERIKQRNPMKLWERQCMNKGCSNTFQTTYAPDRKEIVYCEACYNKEVG